MEGNMSPATIDFEVVDTTKQTPKLKLPIIPRTDYGVLFVSQYVLPKLEISGYSSEQFTLESFTEKTEAYEVKLAESRKTSFERTPNIVRIHEIIDDAKTGINALKNQLRIDYTSSMAVAKFGVLGIVRTPNGYSYPSSYDNIRESMSITIKGLSELGYENHKYGLAFWQALYEEFTELLLLNRTLSGGSSAMRSTKNELKKELTAYLKLVIYLLKANKGENWLQFARDWGFQREFY